jgi:hypothetical protein
MLERSENGQKLVEEVLKYKDWNLTIFCWLMRALLTKKIQFEKEKSKNQMFMDSIKF